MPAQPIALIIQNKNIERIHYALMVAVSNAALGGRTTLFFALGVAGALRPGGFSSPTDAAFLERLTAANIATPEELLEALAELEARICVCDSAMAFENLALADLRQDVAIEVTGLTDIIANVGDGQIIYV